MKKIVLIACCSKKLKERARAINLYQSDLFKKSIAYAKSINPDEIYILSAKYGLLELEKEVDPYNLTLNKFSEKEKYEWASNVKKSLEEKTDLEKDCFIFLAGQNYRKYPIPCISHYEIPLENKRIGEQLKWLEKNTK